MIEVLLLFSMWLAGYALGRGARVRWFQPRSGSSIGKYRPFPSDGRRHFGEPPYQHGTSTVTSQDSTK